MQITFIAMHHPVVKLAYSLCNEHWKDIISAITAYQKSIKRGYHHLPHMTFPHWMSRRVPFVNGTSETLSFHTFATESRWNKVTLRTAFCEGHTESLQSELTCKGNQLSLNQLIQLTIHTDKFHQARWPRTSSSIPPIVYHHWLKSRRRGMEVDQAKIFEMQKSNQRREGHCLCTALWKEGTFLSDNSRPLTTISIQVSTSVPYQSPGYKQWRNGRKVTFTHPPFQRDQHFSLWRKITVDKTTH